MYYVREDSRNCCKNDSEHIKILDQSLGVLSSQILLIPRHAKQFFVSDEDNDQAGIVQTVELLHLCRFQTKAYAQAAANDCQKIIIL